MRRIMIIGQPGSGKPTLARALGVKTGLPVVHIDHIHWQPGWEERSQPEKTRMCHEVEAREAWIFEGGHSTTWPNRVSRADLVIWPDFPIALRFWRILRRTVVYHGRSRPDLPDNCPEGLHRETLPFWHFVWRTRHPARNRIVHLLNAATDGKLIIHLRRRFEVARFLSEWPK